MTIPSPQFVYKVIVTGWSVRVEQNKLIRSFHAQATTCRSCKCACDESIGALFASEQHFWWAYSKPRPDQSRRIILSIWVSWSRFSDDIPFTIPHTGSLNNLMVWATKIISRDWLMERNWNSDTEADGRRENDEVWDAFVGIQVYHRRRHYVGRHINI